MLEHNLDEHCGDASCTICAWNDLTPVKLSPQPPVTCKLARAYDVQNCQHPDCPICFPPSPQRNVTYGWEGLDDEYVVFSHPNGPVEPGVIIKDELVQP